MKIQSAEHGQERSVEQRLFQLDGAVAEKAPGPRPKVEGGWRLLGRDVGCPVGLAASPLTRSAQHIGYFARHRFNVLTFKTMRSIEWRPHPKPNWVYVSQAEPLPLEEDLANLTLYGDDSTAVPPGSPVSTANSYGVPSPTPEQWQAELTLARELVGDHQLLIASVQGSPEIYSERRQLIDDFVHVARLAAATEVTAIELNLSCPNTVDYHRGVRPPLCTSNAALTREIVVAVREALPEIGLVAKLSYMREPFLGAIVASLCTVVDAIAGINTLPAKVLTPSGEPTFPHIEGEAQQGRDVAGVSGIAVRNLAVDFVEALASLRSLNNWTFDVIGVGGVMSAEDALLILERGANAVQVATGALDRQQLAAEVASHAPLTARK